MAIDMEQQVNHLNNKIEEQDKKINSISNHLEILANTVERIAKIVETSEEREAKRVQTISDITIGQKLQTDILNKLTKQIEEQHETQKEFQRTSLKIDLILEKIENHEKEISKLKDGESPLCSNHNEKLKEFEGKCNNQCDEFKSTVALIHQKIDYSMSQMKDNIDELNISDGKIYKHINSEDNKIKEDIKKDFKSYSDDYKAEVAKIDDKQAKLQYWIMGNMFTTLIFFLGTILSIILTSKGLK
ncbi:hypothetical protein [uncultured Arcobacter sp.]|uniref:hypothetical protein n=1 Tax=uncultured Arcobacter sp. TaxID=165434 RepID=UPI00261FC7BB|nr:hypothetical protein [uncultured Arcobacter sp.]